MVSIIPKIEQLSPRIIRVLGCNPGHMTLQGTNTYIIGTGDKRVLVDAGEKENKEYIGLLSKTLMDNKTQISDVIITHWHHDHIGGLCDVLTATNRYAKVHKMACPVNDKPLPEWVNLCPLKHLQEISVDGATLRAHHTPGHTEDHMVLELPGEDPDCGVFTGDCILGEGTTVFEDLHDYMKSLELLQRLSYDKLYPGHGPVVTDGRSKVQQYISHRNEREQQIYETLQQNNPATPTELVKIVYKETPEYLHAAAEVNLRHHLSKLLKEGRVMLLDTNSDSYAVVAAARL